MRAKNRYILVRVTARNLASNRPIPIAEKHLAIAIRDSLQTLYGDYTVGRVGNSLQGTSLIRYLLELWTDDTEVKYMNGVTRMGIVRVSREEHQKILEVLKRLSQIGSTLCHIETLHVSGIYP